MGADHEKEHLEQLQKAGMAPATLAKLYERHLGVGKSPPVESPFRKYAERPKIFNLPKATIAVRFLGPIFPALVHWRDDGTSYPCFGAECVVCPAQASMYGYAPVLMKQRLPTGEDKELKTVLSLWASLALELEELEVCRGMLVEFNRHQAHHVRVAILETESPFVLPPWFDVRDALKCRYGLREWPDQGFDLEGPGFKRKQA